MYFQSYYTLFYREKGSALTQSFCQFIRIYPTNVNLNLWIINKPSMYLHVELNPEAVFFQSTPCIYLALYEYTKMLAKKGVLSKIEFHKWSNIRALSVFITRMLSFAKNLKQYQCKEFKHESKNIMKRKGRIEIFH